MKPKTPKHLLNSYHVATYIPDDVLQEINRVAQKHKVSKSHVLRKVLTTLFDHDLVDQYMI